MRFVAVILAVVALLGCKGKQQPDKQVPPEVTQPSGSAAHSRGPAVTGPGVVQVSRLSATIVYGATELSLDGSVVGPVGASGMITDDAVAALVRMLEGKVHSDDPVGVALHPELPFVRIVALLGTLKRAGFRNLALLVGGGTMMVPTPLADPADVTTGLRPIVAVSNGRIVLWSASGTEGTQPKPKLDVALATGTQTLTATLAEIVKRRWPGGLPRTGGDRTIMIQVGRTETAETLLRVIAAVRTDGSVELFPAIFLTGGA